MICHLQGGWKFHSKSKGLGTRSTNGVSPSLKAGDDFYLGSSCQIEEKFHPSSTFVLFGPSAGRTKPAYIGEGNLLYLVHQFKC